MEPSSRNEASVSVSNSSSGSTHTSPSHSRAPSSIPMRNIDNAGNAANHLQPMSISFSNSSPSAANHVHAAPSTNILSSNSSLSVPIDPFQQTTEASAYPTSISPATDSLSNQPQPQPPQQSLSQPNQASTSSSSSSPLVPINHFSNPNLRSDLILLISQWLQDEGFGATRLMLLDEANVKNREREELKTDNKKLRKALMEGDFTEVDKLLSKGIIKHQKAFKYSVYKQQYLEFIEQREFQKAFTFLNKRLKPLEHYQPNSTEFQNLCYLLTSKSVTDAPQFRNWEGIQPAREKLVAEYDQLVSMERAEKEGGFPTSLNNNPSSNSSSSSSSHSILGGMRGIGSNDPNENQIPNHLSSSEDANNQRNLGDELSHLNLNTNHDMRALSSLSDPSSSSNNHNSNLSQDTNSTSKNNLSQHQRELNGGNYVPPHRLITLLSQSLTHQIESARYKAQKTPVIETLMWDWRAMVVPNFNQRTLRGHRRNVKCLSFVGESGEYLVSGSSDNTVRLWSISQQNKKPIHMSSTQVPASTTTASNPSSCVSVLTGHASRVWSVDSTKSGQLICSGSGDGTVRIWKTNALSGQSSSILAPNFNSPSGPSYGVSNNSFVNSNGIHGSYLDSIRSGDIYACKFLPNETQVVAAGYDRIIKIFDISSSSCIRTFTGHQGAVSSLSINPSGNLMASASKDGTIKVWDLIGGHVKTLETHLGEVTSVSISESGTLLLSNSKDNSCRLIDFRMLKPLKRLTGHSNTNKNFIRSSFLHSNLVVSGSEDGLLYLWNVENGENGEQIETLKAHGFKNSAANGFENQSTTNASSNNAVYEAVWNRNKNLLASCGDDGTVRTWTHEQQ